ncbi:MAG: hypothetical protein HYR93_09595 [Chloroflexi bacterium]|nr:hypothetical protein [Chloroflexota bacterium]
MNKYIFIKDLFFIIPTAFIAGAGLAALQDGIYWIGLFGFSLLLLLGLSALVAAWRWGGGGKALAWMTALAFILRLAAGVAVYFSLPVNGYDVPDDKAGYIFTDAHRRDDQAWGLASSNKPLWSAFDKSYAADQYGGLLALSAFMYRYLSPDVQRPLLVLTLAALTAALGVPFFYKSTRLLWDGKLAAVSSWLFVLYPESVLTGGAQMREPFLLTFIAVAFWGFAGWLKQNESGEKNRSVWLWLGIGIAGLLLVSPAMALALLVLFGGWLWLRGEKARLPWQVLVGVGGVFLVGVLLLAWSLSRQHDFGGGSPVGVILNWIRDSVKYVIYLLERGSGQIQNIFSKMNPLVQFLFVIGYGIAQPVLPPAFFEPTTLTWRIIAIVRALGWYVVLPLLLYSPIAAWKSEPGRARRLWLWLSAFSWLWILISAIRAGGDQWDNPRYRLIFFGWQALAAGYAWLWWRQHRDNWLPRIFILEIVSVLLYGQWYLARYNSIGFHLPILVVLEVSVVLFVLTFVGGWWWDHWRAGKRRA